MHVFFGIQNCGNKIFQCKSKKMDWILCYRNHCKADVNEGGNCYDKSKSKQYCK